MANCTVYDSNSLAGAASSVCKTRWWTTADAARLTSKALIMSMRIVNTCNLIHDSYY